MDFVGEDTPESITQDILKYLEEQEIFGEGDFDGNDQAQLNYIQSLIEQLIEKIANRAEHKEDYLNQLKAHNQYPLFDLSEIIPDFYIDDNLYEQLTFRETLVISSFEISENPHMPIVVGGLCLDVQSAKGKNPLLRKQTGLRQSLIELITNLQINKKLGKKSISQEELDKFVINIKPQYERNKCKFLVHLSSEFDVDGHQGGSRITAWVDRNFHTLEEKRQEFISKDDTLMQKSIYCGIQPRCYYIKHTSAPEQLLDKKYYSLQKASKLIGEGANFVLMRYLALTRYMGKFELATIYINGDLCRNFYDCTGPESGIINEQRMDLCKIHRTIVEECGITHHCTTVLTLYGQIVKQEWKDCDYILQLNPLAYIQNEKPRGNEDLLLQHVWEKDMELLSRYLDSKTTYSLDIKSYLADHPELQNMMADYVKKTLFMKPDDILDFTISHFKRYCERDGKCSQPLDDEDEDEAHIIV